MRLFGYFKKCYYLCTTFTESSSFRDDLPYVRPIASKLAWHSLIRKVGRVIDRAGLEIRYTPFGYRGFESLTFRHKEHPHQTRGCSYFKKIGYGRALALIRAPARIYKGGRPNIYGLPPESDEMPFRSLLHPVFFPVTTGLFPLSPQQATFQPFKRHLSILYNPPLATRFAESGVCTCYALLSTVQMPTGIPVATVAVNGGANAALLAAQILAVEDADLAAKLDAKRKADAEVVLAKDAGIAERL